MPALSIIIPVYNSERHLKQCVDSVLAQSYADFEIILVDDGSTDLSGKLCDEYASRYTNVYVFHKKNEGVSAARNKGIEQARGEYVVFVDSDDWLEKDALSLLMQHGDMADLMFFGSAFHAVDKGVKTYCPELHMYKGLSELQEGMIDLVVNPKYPDYLGYTWNKVFKRSILKECNIRFIDNLAYREDEAFTLQYAYYCKNLITLPDIIYNYRISDTGLTKKKHSGNEYMLLSHAYQQCLFCYTNNKLQEYIASQIVRNYLNAIKRTSYFKKRNVIIEELWLFYHTKNVPNLSLNIKSVYLYLLSLSSACYMKFYMGAKLLFK